MAVRHVLLDADGVLQQKVGGGRTLRGEADFGPALSELLRSRGIATPADEVYADLWLAIEEAPSGPECRRRPDVRPARRAVAHR